MKTSVFALLLLLFNNAQAQKELEFTDKTYEEQIKTVILLPESAPQTSFMHGVVPIRQQNLILEFDDLADAKENYYLKLIHCNYDWTKSTLMNLDFLQSYNEINITDYQFSSSLYLQYVHYRVAIPAVKLPGNYLLLVYRNGDEEDLILTKRMIVFDNRTSMARDNKMAGIGNLQSSNQQLNFTINYQNVQIVNPLESVHVIIRQNQRWDNARLDVKPSFVREDRSELEYRFFDQDKQFEAGNEFRFVDFRSLNFPGQNTLKLDRSVKPFELFVQPDKPRTDMVYAQYKDLNGGYFIENRDYQDAAVTGTYVYVNFQLNASKPVNGDVYINGTFNNWQRGDENRMKYNSSTSAYEGSVLLKQGWYNYQYWVDSKSLSGNYFEGSHFETENYYEVLIYYRPFQPNADMLIGYFGIPVNPR